MNKSTSKQPNRGQFTVLRRICPLIPPLLVPKVARETGVDEKNLQFVEPRGAWPNAAPALRAAPIKRGHLRIESRLIDEDQASRIPLRLLAAPPQIGFGLLIQRTFSGVFLIFVFRQLIEAS